MQQSLSCVYCGSVDNITQDHIPPKSFFPIPRPSNLITVPSCRDCNQGYSKDEELFLATFMFTDAGVSDTGKRLWAEKMHRMYTKNLGIRKKIVNSLKHVELITPSGIHLGKRMAIKYDEPRSERVVNKMVRGLYFFEFQKPILSSIEIGSRFAQHASDIPTAIEDIAPSLIFGTRQWPGIFEYRFNRVTEQPEKSIWILRFFGKVVFGALQGSKSPSYTLSHVMKIQNKTVNQAVLFCIFCTLCRSLHLLGADPQLFCRVVFLLARFTDADNSPHSQTHRQRHQRDNIMQAAVHAIYASVTMEARL